MEKGFDIKLFNQLKEKITREYHQAIAALDLVYKLSQGMNGDGIVVELGNDHIDLSKLPPVKAGSIVLNEICRVDNCGKKLRSDSKTCPECSKRVCSRHFDRDKDSCYECAGRPEAK